MGGQRSTNSFNKIIESFRLPKGTEAEKTTRTAAIQSATKYAVQVPFKVMELSLATFEVIKAMAEFGNPNSVTDAGVGALCARTAVMGAFMNVKINCKDLDDKAFVDDIETSQQGRNMVATIVTIAHNLGMKVVAEGVETNQQLSFLSGLRCEQLQGFLYSKPLPEDDFQKYLLSFQITSRSTTFGTTPL